MINEKILQSKKFARFLEDGRNASIYSTYRMAPTDENAMRLNEAYKKFERRLIAKSYLRKVIIFEAKKYDARIRAAEEKHASMYSINEEGVEIEMFFINEKSSLEYEKLWDCSLEEIFEDCRLHRAISKLTSKQKRILSQIYLSELSEKEIADKLNLSQQAVSKVHRTALKRLKEVVKP